VKGSEGKALGKADYKEGGVGWFRASQM